MNALFNGNNIMMPFISIDFNALIHYFTKFMSNDTNVVLMFLFK